MTRRNVITPDASASVRPSLTRRFDALLARLFKGFMDKQKENRRSQFEVLGVPPDRVVLLGDSITEGGLWNEWFPHAPVTNRGIGGETSADVLARLASAINAPRAVFLLVGTNDLGALVPLAQIVDNVRAILVEIEREAPGTQIFVQSVMPRTAPYTDDVRALNRANQALIATVGRHVTYVDLWSVLVAPDGTLRTEFTSDGLHLNGRGYAAWVEVLRPLFASLGYAPAYVGSVSEVVVERPQFINRAS